MREVEFKSSPLSACIITYNEEDKIKECLESIKWVTEVVVVDSFSQDRTVEICKEYGAKVFQTPWRGFVEQKNYALKKASFPWVLCLDADERVSPELREEIIKLLQEEKPADGYYIPRLSFYLGRWIKHGGWYPDYKLRLFKKEKGRWTGMDPHDRVILKGKTERLKGNLLHFPYQNLTHHLKKINSYTTIMAEGLKKQGKKVRGGDIFFRPLFKFIKGYFLKKGFLDGVPGFIIALTGSFYVGMKYAKLWEIQKNLSFEKKREG